MISVRLLGPVELQVSGQVMNLGPPKRRAVFAALAVDAGRPVSTGTLVDRVWDEAPPAEARNALYAHILHIRRVLAAATKAGGTTVQLTRCAGGYRVDIDRDTVDLHRFRRLAEQAHHSRPSDDERVVALREALGLWRGTPLAGLPGSWAARVREGCRQQHVDALLALARAELRLGNHETVITQLTDVLPDYPTVEPLTVTLMRALHTAGRTPEALDHYLGIRQRLVDGLGVEPGPELQALHQALLRGEPVEQHDRRPPAGPAPEEPVPGRTAPAMLPLDVSCFAGRADELARLDAVLAGADRPSTTPAICVISGTAGVGKTAFAVHVAHRVADRYPDGQLFVELRGAHSRPAEPYDVLGSFLRVLGVPPLAIPEGLDERAMVYRSLTARRRVLVLLDDAADEGQVRPLLPASPTCAVVVTSRERLAGLAGHRVSLGVLPRHEALALLGSGVGAERVAAEPDAADAIVTVCGRLPLAVHIAAARLVVRPDWRLARLAQRLHDQRGRLDELAAGDLAVRTSLSLSYQGLDEPRAEAFCGLGLLDLESFPAWVAAALLGIEVDDAERVVESLVDVHLLETVGESRYQFHDLVRLYAREQAEKQAGAVPRDTAVRRAASAYLDLARRCGGALGSDFLGLVEHPSRRWALPEHAATALTADPLAWFDGERTAAGSVVDQAISHGEPELAGELAAALATLFEARNCFDDWRRTHERALAALRADGGRHTITAALLRNLGELHTIQDRYDLAATYFEEALTEADEPAYRAAAIAGLGYVSRLLGRYDRALSCFEQGRLLAEKLDNPRGVAYAVNGCGTVYLERGTLSIARLCFEESLARSTAIDHLPGVATALRGLGHVHRLGGQGGVAAGYYERARSVAHQLDNVLFDAHAAEWLADVWLDQGRQDDAQQLLAWCLSIFRSLGNRFGEASTLRTLARVHLAGWELDQARECALTALATWRRIQSPYWSADTLDVLAEVHEQGGDRTAAAEARLEAQTSRTACGITVNPRLVHRSAVR
ncbi:BTAD domain-containing putative transcriptional regulator [Krasilnikovia sp. MM14-A1259]|uniref:AfsR/SARP family transcriptional regulator n=1 Tax=Krasilnikovia sp. MM14-A1259 TaxID=3373539 RepID=UPI00399D1090